MLVDMIAVHEVQVALVQIVGVAVVVHCRVPTVMGVCVRFTPSKRPQPV